MKPDIARIMWDAYCAQSIGGASEGKPPLAWDDLGLERQSSWEAAATAATSALMKPPGENGAGRYLCDCLTPCGVKACPGWRRAEEKSERDLASKAI